MDWPRNFGKVKEKLIGTPSLVQIAYLTIIDCPAEVQRYIRTSSMMECVTTQEAHTTHFCLPLRSVSAKIDDGPAYGPLR